jgi:hypothetical protein
MPNSTTGMTTEHVMKTEQPTQQQIISIALILYGTRDLRSLWGALHCFTKFSIFLFLKML